MTRRVRSNLTTVLLIGLAAAGCRDDVAPFESADAGAPASRGQLTTSAGDDRAPSWSESGDSVFYSAEGFGVLPPARGVLVGLPREGGPALEILTNAQLPNEAGLFPWFTAPVLSPQGDRLAYLEIAPLMELGLFCDTALAVTVCQPAQEAAPLPPLRQVLLRVRGLEETGAIEDDPSFDVQIPGIVEQEIVNPSIFDPPIFHIVHDYPFQQLFRVEQALVIRASWAPDGERLVFSDGLRLLIWEVGSSEADTIPGTEDGIEPAWSPDGEWIAFSRIERADSSNATCQFLGGLGPCEGHVRTDYLAGRRMLSVIRPDGSELRELTEGDEPAWTPDGDRLFFRHGGRLWSVAVSGGDQPTQVTGTEGGREPAVSPDGRFLAFAKLMRKGDYDIWVATLQR